MIAFIKKWNVLSCGHSLCSPCHGNLLTRSEVIRTKSVTCPICREVSTEKATYFVCSKNKSFETFQEALKENKKPSQSLKGKSYVENNNDELRNIKIKVKKKHEINLLKLTNSNIHYLLKKRANAIQLK